jgi:hypothetical protein
MTVAYIGNFEPEYSTENDVRKAYEAIGWDVIKLQENAIDFEHIEMALEKADMLLITGTWGEALPLHRWLDLMHRCAKRGIPTATLHLDTFWGTSRGGRKWWREPMFHTAYIFTADGDYQDEWKLMGKNHFWLRPAVRHDAVKKGTFRSEYAHDVSFVGSNGDGYHEDVWGYRKELLDNIRKICSKNGWRFRNPGGDEPKIDRSDDMNDFYASVKISVGDSLCLKKEDSKYWSDRVPEALGRGSYLIMPRINALDNLYPDIGKYDWGDWESLESTMRIAMGHDLVAIKDRQIDLIDKNETYVNRVLTILEELGFK